LCGKKFSREACKQCFPEQKIDWIFFFQLICGKSLIFLGHATLASAFVLFSQNYTKSKKITFKTRSGDLIVTKNDEDLYQMDFPRGSCAELPLPEETKKALELALGINSKDLVSSYYAPVSGKLILEVSNFTVIKNLKPSSRDLLATPFPQNVLGVSVSTPHLDDSQFAGKFDFASRYFAPWVGIEEDPVNGSSHTILAGYYAKKLNKTKFLAYMASERSGVLGVQLSGDDRVILEGRACLTLTGKK